MYFFGSFGISPIMSIMSKLGPNIGKRMKTPTSFGGHTEPVAGLDHPLNVKDLVLEGRAPRWSQLPDGFVFEEIAGFSTSTTLNPVRKTLFRIESARN
jgi:hypothetical protein